MLRVSGVGCRVSARWVPTTAGWSAVLLRPAYLGVTNTFAMLRLLPLSARGKDAEILALRHQETFFDPVDEPAHR